MKSVGIHSVGTYLPTEVRTNDWWPEAVVGRWSEKSSGKLDRPAEKQEAESEGARLVVAAMAELRDDPFKGARERRVMPEGMLTSDMEIAAAEQAIQRSGLDRQDIDLVLSSTSVPDHLMVPNGCKIHEALGLPRRSFVLQMDGACNAFQMQLSLAKEMIRGGRAKNALLVQSAATTRLMRPEDPMSAWFGDGAAAEVVGPVAEGFGLLGQAHEADGSLYEGLVCGIPDRRWYESGAVQAYIIRPELPRRLLLESVQQSKTLFESALIEAGLQKKDVAFYAGHQGFAWLRKVTQRLMGLEHARTLDTFPWAGSLIGANLPLILDTAAREGLLQPGDVVASFSGASGALVSSLVFRWGTGST